MASASRMHEQRLARLARLCERAEQTVGADVGDRYRSDLSDHRRVSHDLNRLQVGRAPDDLARMAAHSLEQNIEGLAAAALVEAGMMAIDRLLQPLQPPGLDVVCDLIGELGRGRAWPRRIL